MGSIRHSDFSTNFNDVRAFAFDVDEHERTDQRRELAFGLVNALEQALLGLSDFTLRAKLAKWILTLERALFRGIAGEVHRGLDDFQRLIAAYRFSSVDGSADPSGFRQLVQGCKSAVHVWTDDDPVGAFLFLLATSRRQCQAATPLVSSRAMTVERAHALTPRFVSLVQKLPGVLAYLDSRSTKHVRRNSESTVSSSGSNVLYHEEFCDSQQHARTATWTLLAWSKENYAKCLYLPVDSIRAMAPSFNLIPCRDMGSCNKPSCALLHVPAMVDAAVVVFTQKSLFCADRGYCRNKKCLKSHSFAEMRWFNPFFKTSVCDHGHYEQTKEATRRTAIECQYRHGVAGEEDDTPKMFFNERASQYLTTHGAH